jgi:ATP-binding cassette, subfamily B, bacterial
MCSKSSALTGPSTACPTAGQVTKLTRIVFACMSGPAPVHTMPMGGRDGSAGSAQTGVLRRALDLFRPYRRQTSYLLLCVLVSSALGIASPALTKFIFDRALFPPTGGPRLGLLGLLVGLIALAVALGGALAVVQTYLASVIGQSVMHDLRQQLYGHLQRMSLRFFTHARTGDLQARLAQDVGGVGPVVGNGVASVLSSSIFIVASIAVMAVLSWQLTLVALLVFPAFVYLSYRVGGMRRRLAKRTQETLSELSTLTEETLSVSGMLLAKLFDRHRDTVDRYGRESRRLAELSVQQQMAGLAMIGLAQTFFLVSPAAIYLTAGFVLADSTTHITPGTLVAFTALQTRLFFPARDLLETSIQVQSSLALFERIFQYLDLPPEIADSPQSRPLRREAVRGRVAFRNVSFDYSDVPDETLQLADVSHGSAIAERRWALNDITTTIEPGQFAALVGPTGAGKTTMTYLLARLYDVSGGAVEIDGMDVRSIELESLRSIVGFVTQETTLFHATVRENLLYARPDATPEDCEAAARAALIHDRIVELADGYDTIVGERGYRMSGGEKQRLAIARVLLKDPRILIFDEATSSLDTLSERLIQKAIEPLLTGRTTIGIAHRLSTILAADVILVLDKGRLVERGTHDELLAAGGLYARLFERQFASESVPATATKA